MIPKLHNYTIITPLKNYPKQQNDKQNGKGGDWSCGIHSSANIVGIILNEEIKRGRVPDLRDKPLDSSGYSILEDSLINVASGKGIASRSELQTRDYFGVFILAFTQYGQEHTNRLVPLRLLRS